MNKISAIICVYNEEKTIKNVVMSIAIDSIFDEIIVVNDGSTDYSDEELKKINEIIDFKYIILCKNKGKGYAMAVGVENAQNPIIVFIDADLSNLKEEHFASLINPIIEDEADMVLGQANDTLINYYINPFKSFTGERALLRKDIINIVDKMKKSRFGVETLINLHYQSEGKLVKYVMLKGLKHPTKFEKVPKQQAVREFIKEGYQIVLTVFKNFDLIRSSLINNLKL